MLTSIRRSNPQNAAILGEIVRSSGSRDGVSDVGREVAREHVDAAELHDHELLAAHLVHERDELAQGHHEQRVVHVAGSRPDAARVQHKGELCF